MGRKIARGFGAAVCVLLFLLCVFMIVVSAVFGSEGLVGAFGYNLYLCEASSFEGVPAGSAVIVEQCEPYDLVVGTLILYSAGEEGSVTQALGYTESISHKDGVYSIEITDVNQKPQTISESSFVGRAGWSSLPLGKIIRFSLSPWGIVVMAVLPCLALIVYSVIKGVAEELPPPEVIPQMKNAEPEQPKPQKGLSVKPDGNAEYSRSGSGKAPRTADSVLFTYGTRNGKSPAVMKPDAPARPAAAPARAEKPANAGGVPSSVAARKYIDNATAAKTPKTAPQRAASSERAAVPQRAATPARASGSTAELNAMPKKTRNDAFFTQSSAPQIGKQRPKPETRAVIDLEEALATVGERQSSRKTTDSAARRSADIIASKRREELIAEDDDQRDKNRYDVDDILAGIERRRKS